MPPEAPAVSNEHPEFTVNLSVAGVLAVANSPIHWVAPYPCEVSYVVGTVNTAPGTGPVTVDVLKNDVTIFSGAEAGRRPVIAVGTKTSPIVQGVRAIPASTNVIGLAGAQYSPGTNDLRPVVPDNGSLVSLAAGETLSIGVTTVGTTPAGSDLGVTLGIFRK